MRILVVSQYFWPENFRVNDLAVELLQRGHQVTVLTGWPNYPDGVIRSDFRCDPEKFSNYLGVEIVRVPLLARGRTNATLIANYLSFAVSASLLGAARLAERIFDVIFVYQASPVTVGVPAILLKHIKHAPIVFWVQDLWPESLQAVGAVHSPWLLRRVGDFVSGMYSQCDLVLAQSRSFVRLIKRHCDEPGKVRYFPNWAEDLFGRQKAPPAPEVPPAPGIFSVMFAGNIGDAQDFPSILTAAEILRDRKDIRWLIVGDGRASEWVGQEILRRRLGQSVIQLGRHPLERMPSFYTHADALLVSLRRAEVFSMTIPGKLQSYLASGLPIVGMLDGEGAAVIAESGAGDACPAGDSHGLAGVVSRMARLSKEDRAQIGAAGRRYYLNEFDRQRLLERLDGWLNEVAAH